MPTARIKLFQLTFQSRDDAPDGAPYGTKPQAMIAQLAAARASLSSVNVGFALRDAVEGNDIETIKPLDAIETLDDLTDDETIRLAEGVTGFRSDIYEAWADVDVYDLTSALADAGCAVSVFTVDDVAERFSGEDPAAWLQNNRRNIEDLMTTRGNEAIDDLLTGDGLFRNDDEDDDQTEADDEEDAMRLRGVSPETFDAMMKQHTAFIISYGAADTEQIRITPTPTFYATLESAQAEPGSRRAVIFEVETTPNDRGFYKVVKTHPRH